MITVHQKSAENSRAFALTRFFNEDDLAKALQYVSLFPDAIIVCLDTPATPMFLKFVETVTSSGRKVVVRDHHDVEGEPKSLRDEEIKNSANRIREISEKESVISNRVLNPGCSSLVGEGEFASGNYCIICDADADGLTAGMKAIGAVYPELDSDAGILDGPPVKKTRENGLSPFGELLVKGSATLPPFNDSGHEGKQQELYQLWFEATQGNEQSLEILREKVKVFDEMVANAKLLAETSVLLSDRLRFVDLSKKQGKIHLGTLEQELERLGGDIFVTKTIDGPIAKVSGAQYSIARRTDRKDINMLSFFPEGFTSSPESGYIGNVPFRAHCSEENWNAYVLPKVKEFLEKQENTRLA